MNTEGLLFRRGADGRGSMEAICHLGYLVLEMIVILATELGLLPLP
jgi:hypothetical protein